MKLVGTRIRVEKSEHKTEYFPEYCLEEKTWFGLGKPKLTWYGTNWDAPFKFGLAERAVDFQPDSPQHYTLKWAQMIIDYQASYWADYQKEQSHEENKEITYVKYP